MSTYALWFGMVDSPWPGLLALYLLTLAIIFVAVRDWWRGGRT